MESLYLEWSGIKNIEQVVAAKSLMMLHIGSSQSLQSISPLSDMKQLKWLGLEAVTKISSLVPLTTLENLEGLSVEGSMWTTQRVDSLAPIGGLREIKYLAITNLRSRDGTLEPLFALKKLKVFFAAKWWDESEVATIVQNNPGVITN
ncbi:MAG: hypothetical protein Aurels2KO_31150 [Aureliella sp.]